MATTMALATTTITAARILEVMLDDFLLRALLGGIGVAAVAGPLGCFIVWRRMAYFGDSLAHSALLGVALGLLLGLQPVLGIALTCVMVALLIVALQRQQRLASDTLLGIFAHSSLALGLVALSFFETLRVDLMGYLFGDILAIDRLDLMWIYCGGGLVLGLLALIWRPLLMATISEELARAEKIPVTGVRIVFMLAIAATIAAAMKVVGILLITSLLIIPAASARRFATTPEGMALLAIAAGVLAVCLGLFASFSLDTPSGPSIVVAALAIFVSSLSAGVLLAWRAAGPAA